MKYRYKLPLFFLPFILIPVIFISVIVFLTTSSIVKNLKFELIQYKLKSITDDCENQYLLLQRLRMENTDFYVNNVQRGVIKYINNINIENDTIFIVNSNGELIFSTKEILNNIVSDKEILKQIINNGNNVNIYKKNGIKYYNLIEYFDKWDWYIVYSIDENSLYGKITKTTNIILIIVLLSIALLLFLAYIFTNIETKKIKILTDASEKITKGNFDFRLEIESDDEIGILADTFNIMTKKLNSTINELTRSNKELEQFAYVASHDLQEPLRMITSYIELLEKRYKDKLDDNANEFLDFIIDGAQRMNFLIKDLLALSRVGTRGKDFEPMDSTLALEQAISNIIVLIKENCVNISYQKLPLIEGDFLQIVQLFQNILINSIKFRKDECTPEISIYSVEEADKWIFNIKDNGIGIESKFFEKIFVIFQRLHKRNKYPGTGIGLAICKKIVERHGGNIGVQSTPGEGSIFYFTIPKK